MMKQSDNPVTSRLAPSFLPATAVLEMTYRCNHTCTFCSCPWESPAGEFAREPELTTSDWQHLIAKLCTMGVCNIAFTGGEPLLKEDILDIIKFAAARKTEHIETVAGALRSTFAPPKLYLLSNGTAMSDEVLRFCKEHGVQLSMSLPGLTTYRDHTGAGDPDTVLGWFRRAKEMGVATVVNSTVTAKNLFELYNTLSAAFLAGAGQLLMNRFLPGGRGLAYAEDLAMHTEQVREMLAVADQVLVAADRHGNVGTELPKCVVEGLELRRLVAGTRCSAALGFFVVGPSGYLRTCNHSPVRLNHSAEIDTVKHHPYWRRFVMKDYLPTACGPCDLRNDCDGGCREAAHLVGGAVDAPDPLLREMAVMTCPR